MTAEDIIAIFEGLALEERVVPLDEALAGFAGWIADHRSTLTETDFAALTAVGATMYEIGLQRRMTARLPA